jgi:hypothetical protein
MEGKLVSDIQVALVHLVCERVGSVGSQSGYMNVKLKDFRFTIRKLLQIATYACATWHCSADISIC